MLKVPDLMPYPIKYLRKLSNIGGKFLWKKQEKYLQKSLLKKIGEELDVIVDEIDEEGQSQNKS